MRPLVLAVVLITPACATWNAPIHPSLTLDIAGCPAGSFAAAGGVCRYRDFGPTEHVSAVASDESSYQN